jgi:hypothetical protein
METVGIKMKKAALLAYALISAPGKYELEVANNVSEKNLYSEEGKTPRYIVGLKAISSDKIAQAQEVFKEVEEVEIEQTNGLFLTASIWKNDENQPSLPMKGEKVECAVGFVPDRDGVEVLRVLNMRVLAAKKADKFKFDEITAPKEGTLTHA